MAYLSDSPLNPQHPLPTQREWARRLGVSVATVNRVLAELKREGLVTSRAGSYTYPVGGRASEKVVLSRFYDARRSPDKIRSWAIHEFFQKSFCRAHPVVELRNIPLETASAEASLAVTRSLLTGPDPVLVEEDRTRLRLYRDFGAVVDLRPYAEGRLNGYLDTLRPDCRAAAYVGGELLMLPYGVTRPYLLYYRPALLQAGLDPARLPRTMHGLIEWLHRLQSRQDGAPAMQLEGADFPAWLLMLLAYDESSREADGTLAAVDWRAPQSLRAVQALQALFAGLKPLAGSCEYQGMPFRADLLSGKIPVTLDTGSLAGLLLGLGAADDFVLGPIPGLDGVSEVAPANLGGWIFNAHASAPQHRAAIEYVLAWQDWRRYDPLGRQREALREGRSLWSVYGNHSTPANVPASWRAHMERAEALTSWEPWDADALRLSIRKHLAEWLRDESLATDLVATRIFLTEHAMSQ